MAKLSENIENRVDKLPKPSNHTQALQPLFEAISNSIFAIEDRITAFPSTKGLINVSVSNIGKPTKLEIEVDDNGIGIDKSRFAAFCELDTDFKKNKGGKGVGRLFWLDAFSQIAVSSHFIDKSVKWSRHFRFALSNAEQILEESLRKTTTDKTGTSVVFTGLRQPDYQKYFPKKADTFTRYLSAHFISDFLLGKGPSITVNIDGDVSVFPQEVKILVVGKMLETGVVDHPDFGPISIQGFTCKPQASTGLDGLHQIHLLANERTVESRKIDNLLGVTDLTCEDEHHLSFHGCVSSEYLNKRVNEGRTAFNIPESKLKELIRYCVDLIKEKLIPEQVALYAEHRKHEFTKFVERYPIYGFDDAETQLDRVPFHARMPEEFAAGLVKYQIRRDEDRQNAIQSVIGVLEHGDEVPLNFTEAVVKAAQGLQASEQLALAQHVVRRKLVLELLDRLIKRLREREGKSDDFQLEKTLHSFICPMGIRGDDPAEVKGRSHDLWIIDERLAFTRAFSSDKRLDSILRNTSISDRPDLLLWNLSYGMASTDPSQDKDYVDISEPISKMMIVELKRPMRLDYSKPEDQIEQQIIKYISHLKGNQLESFDRDRIRIASDCVFYCYVVADIVGDLEQQVSNWDTTANGQGRIRALRNEYRGSIELIQWKSLINDAWHRNQATLHAAGLGRS